jgi:ArsR family transcriptional regulator
LFCATYLGERRASKGRTSDNRTVLPQPIGYVMLIAVNSGVPILSPRRRQPAGCCAPSAQPSVDAAQAAALAAVAKALGDPTRLRIVDAVRSAAPEAVCQCELVPLFAMSQPALAKHLKVLVEAGVLASQRRGTWTYYYTRPGGLEDLTRWLS